MNLPKKKIYKNGATLIYFKLKKKCTAVVAGFVFGKNRDKYPEPTAHFLEHMFFKSTKHKDEKALIKAQNDTFCSMENGRTNLFYTEIDFCRSNKALAPCFELASEMLLETKFNSKSIETEKGVIKQELVRKLNNPEQLFYFSTCRTMRTAYSKTTNVLGSEEEIEAINAKGLKKFRDENFISQNFLIAIEGGISFSKAKRLAEKHFIKKLNSNPNYPVDNCITVPHDKPGNMNVEFYNFKKAICQVSIKLDQSLETLKSKKIMQMFCKISNGITGKIMGKLRDKGLVYSCSTTWQTVPNYILNFKINCSSENTNKCIDELGKILNSFRTTKIDNELIERKRLNAKLARDEATPHVYPSELFSEYLYSNKVEFFSKKFRKDSKKIYKSLNADDILEFSKAAFSVPENIYVTILSGDPPETFYTYEEIQNILTKNKKLKK